jgi:hypothetical protein
MIDIDLVYTTSRIYIKNGETLMYETDSEQSIGVTIRMRLSNSFSEPRTGTSKWPQIPKTSPIRTRENL